MPTIKGDIAVRIGSYTKDGAEKGRYITIGTILQGDDGSLFGSIEPFIDLGALQLIQRADERKRGREPRENVSFTVFDRDRDREKPAAASPVKTGSPNEPFDDDIPFN
jgi:hypothetical protein